MRGRKAIPTKLKLLRGNPGRQKLFSREPTDRSSPIKPGELTDAAAAAWDRLKTESPWLQASDSASLALAAQLYADVQELTQQIEQEGRTYKSDTAKGIIIRRHPAVAQLSDARRQLVNVLAHLGMTPCSRTKITAPATKDDLDEFEQFTKHA